jgi:hypothetical protein
MPFGGWKNTLACVSWLEPRGVSRQPTLESSSSPGSDRHSAIFEARSTCSPAFATDPLAESAYGCRGLP